MPLSDDFFKSNQKLIQEYLTEFLVITDTKNIEIEARAGTIMDKISDSRLQLDTPHPVILKSLPPQCHFISGVSEATYERAKKRFEDVTGNTVSEKDVVRQGRRDTYRDGNLVASIKKTRINCVNIYMPGCSVDLRISISREEPADKHTSKNVITTRNKLRTSYEVKDYRVDFTEVDCVGEKNKEIEIEVINDKFKKEEFINFVMNFFKI
ncbi:mRNA-capping enzyme subunit beta [Astathelohania contejeani]|uniref:mRNA-capping enzyme subunit beta n=1 Tax=Astathelohania contejeani TaxID=164912 RepID=A0ABQ7I1W8_9MICR|nr:mRNA-capping enzyme subunit beta [Thelohania contejeani]